MYIDLTFQDDNSPVRVNTDFITHYYASDSGEYTNIVMVTGVVIHVSESYSEVTCKIKDVREFHGRI